ncbi:response regulator transcription factor [uncultured Clostridium sp.]|uniref:response regulator transcription factor n=1 Tax=uncultured Clostridium sp. TaxID=59620 RepID=UPI0025E2AE39|nr:response regulator transcription factor [uncultured Clostridium sp.]
MTNILVVEDDKEINNLLCESLKNEMYNTIQAYDGKEALSKYDENINLVILDLMIPYVDGIEVLRQIREKSKIPVIILSAKDDECDRVVGLSMGADDYMVKPFFIKELIARVKAQLRRYNDYNNTSDNYEDVFIYGDLKVDSRNYKAYKNNIELNLRPKEFDILKLFLSNPNRVFTKEQIFQSVWKDEFISDDNTVMVHIKRLRNKIEDNDSAPRYIKTVWGIGYRLGD